MKKSEVDFPLILSIFEMLQRIKVMEDFQDLSRMYYLVDPQIRACLTKHQSLHRSIKRVDFVPLTLRDLTCEDYINNRIKKMLTIFELLLSFDKTYSKIIYNKDVKVEKLFFEY